MISEFENMKISNNIIEKEKKILKNENEFLQQENMFIYLKEIQ